MEKSLALKEVVSACSFYVDGEGTTEGLTDMSSNTGNCLIYVQIDITNCNLGHKIYKGRFLLYQDGQGLGARFRLVRLCDPS